MKIYEQVMGGLYATDREKGAELVHDALMKIAVGSQFETRIADQRDLLDIENLFGVTERTLEGGSKAKLQVGDAFNLTAEALRGEKGRQAVRELVVNRDPQVDNIVKLITKGEIGADEAFHRLERMGHGAEYVRGAFAGEKSSSHAVSRALGGINEALRGAAWKDHPEFQNSHTYSGRRVGHRALAGLLLPRLRAAARKARTATVRRSGSARRTGSPANRWPDPLPTGRTSAFSPLRPAPRPQWLPPCGGRAIWKSPPPPRIGMPRPKPPAWWSA